MNWCPEFATRSVWFAPFRALAARFADCRGWPTVSELNERLGAEVRFVAAEKRRRRDIDDIYEVRIARRGEVPTRPESWHDFLNALIWAAFPAAKRALTARLGEEQLARAGAGGRLPNARTRVQDALALVDEGGVVVTPAGAVVFGHAVLEHLLDGVAPRVSCVHLAAGDLDAALAARLAAPELGRWETAELGALRPLSDR